MSSPSSSSEDSSKSASLSASAPSCHIDEDILNPGTLGEMDNIAMSFFASACGKNRGAFVLDPPDGNTYGCLHFPENIAELAAIDSTLRKDVVISDANSIKSQFEDGNTTSVETIALLEFLVGNVYRSTPNKATDPYACEFNGLAKLNCPATTSQAAAKSPRTDGLPIRAVSLAGLFIPAPWATGGKEIALKDITRKWYTLQDFEDMKELGLNTVQISVPTAAFTLNDKYGAKVKSVLDNLLEIISSVEGGGLDVVLALSATGDELDAIVTASDYAASKPVVMALTLPAESTISTKVVVDSIRVHNPELPIFLPLNEGDLTKLGKEGVANDPNVFGSLEMSHTSTIADIASSSSVEDRSKLFYHEATACMVRSPLEYTACFQGVPLFLASGFDLSIDDCINVNSTMAPFHDYGQCGRFDETINSEWWETHRASFAARQLFAAERGLGWSFATWKLLVDGEDASDEGLLDSPAKLLSLRDVASAGLFPDLHKDIPAQLACLNPPKNDFAMGDATYAPTQGPPPDCGNGWWNYTTEQCDYWVPPPPPTPNPTRACPDCFCDAELASPESSDNHDIWPLVLAAVIGAAVMLLAGVIYNMITNRNRRSEYSTIPN